MRRFKPRTFNKRKPKTLSQILMLTFVSFIVAIILSVWIINRGIEPTLIEIAETKTNQFAREAINEAVSKRIADDLEADELIDIETDGDGNIVSLNWNSVVINRVLRNTTFRVQNFLKRIERGEITPEETLNFDLDDDIIIQEDTVEEHRAIVRIPIGQATQNALLANLGPQVPVHFRVIGDVQSDVERRVTEYGINNAMIELDIHIQANVQIVIPFATKTTQVETNVPVYVGVVQGQVPDFYNQGASDSPNVSIPFRDLQD
ncbi:sporulation protein YunB [Alkalibacillus silvisoli]|uniref:Sporulation protein YunB n=1 Tax=Alkalibacillus silvisoli TaxID=392823 RepID=A0ABP3JUG4_9BACI